jgi:hypothetical protein
VNGRRSAFLRRMKTRQRGWITSGGFFMAAKIGEFPRNWSPKAPAATESDDPGPPWKVVVQSKLGPQALPRSRAD